MEGLMTEFYLGMIEQSEMEHEIFESMCTCDYMELQCVDEAVLNEGVKDVLQKIKQIIRNIVNAAVKFFNAIAFAIKKKNIETSKEFTELVKKSKDIIKSGNFKKTNHVQYYGDILGGKEYKTGFTKRIQMNTAAILSIQGLLADFDKKPDKVDMYKTMVKPYFNKIEKILADYENDMDADPDSKDICKLIDPNNKITSELKDKYKSMMDTLKKAEYTTQTYTIQTLNEFNKVMGYLSEYLSLKSRLARNYGLVCGLNYVLPTEIGVEMTKVDNTGTGDGTGSYGLIQGDSIKLSYARCVNDDEALKPLDSIKHIDAMEAAYKSISLKLLSSAKESKQFEQGLQKVMARIDRAPEEEAFVSVLNFTKQYINYKTSVVKGMYEGVSYAGNAHINRIMSDLRTFVQANSKSTETK